MGKSIEKLAYGSIKWFVIIPCIVGLGILALPFIFIIWGIGSIISSSIRPYK